MKDHLLMALVPGHDYWESEPVVVRHFGADSVSFQLDDGTELVFNRDELAKALSEDASDSAFYAALSRPRRTLRDG